MPLFLLWMALILYYNLIRHGKRWLTFIGPCVAEGNIFWTYHVNMRLKGRYIVREQILAAVDKWAADFKERRKR